MKRVERMSVERLIVKVVVRVGIGVEVGVGIVGVCVGVSGLVLLIFDFNLLMHVVRVEKHLIKF